MSSHGSVAVTVDDIPEKEKPQNGVAGLKHWRYDLMAGLQVAMMGIPLSLGIAIASGAPPVCGLISAIIAGFVFPFLGGAYITISGPAAGLAPAMLAGMIALGNGDLAVGYPLAAGGHKYRGCRPSDTQHLQCREIRAVFSHLGGRRHVDGDRHADHHQTGPGLSRVHHAPIKSIPKAIISIPEQVMVYESIDLRHWRRDPLPPLFHYRYPVAYQTSLGEVRSGAPRRGQPGRPDRLVPGARGQIPHSRTQRCV